MREPASIRHVPLRAAQDFRDGTHLVRQRARVDAERPTHEALGDPHQEIEDGGEPFAKFDKEGKKMLEHRFY